MKLGILKLISKEEEMMVEHKKTIKQYLTAIKAVINQFPIEDLEKIIKVLEDARERKATLFICGTGPSWPIASNLVCDLSKNLRMLDESKGMTAIGLGDNIPSLTSFAEDEGYERVFSEQLLNLMKPGDVLIAISGAGNTPSIIKALDAAKEIGGITIGLTGFNGGKMKDRVDHCLVIPSDSVEMIADFHFIVDHLITICLRK